MLIAQGLCVVAVAVASGLAWADHAGPIEPWMALVAAAIVYHGALGAYLRTLELLERRWRASHPSAAVAQQPTALDTGTRASEGEPKPRSLERAPELRVRRQSFDPLTGLPDRAMFKALLDCALAEDGRPGRVAVLFFDIDRFKLVNDTLGHTFGDVLLSSLASRFLAAGGADVVVGRLGGDEFGAIIQGDDARDRGIALAERLTNAISHTYKVGGHELFVTTSAGVAINENASPVDILRKADIAVYRAKGHGRACFAVFDPEIDELSEDRLRLDSGLRRAIDGDQLALHYQPEHDLRSGEVVGMEALIRWNHPHRGLLMPAHFMEIAEESGEIVRIGAWALREACQYLHDLIASGDVPSDFTVAVNISATELLHGELAQNVRNALHESGLSAANLKLELTETVIMRDVGLSIEMLNNLHGLGVHLAIDDFGTGYSSLSYIHKLPFDTLKIDQSFVRPLTGPRDERALAIVASIVYLGKASMMQVTAEGIETAWQHDYLQAVGAHTGQGYYLSPPLPADEFVAYLRSHGSVSKLIAA